MTRIPVKGDAELRKGKRKTTAGLFDSLYLIARLSSLFISLVYFDLPPNHRLFPVLLSLSLSPLFPLSNNVSWI